jgi:hypothetical protein
MTAAKASLDLENKSAEKHLITKIELYFQLVLAVDFLARDWLANIDAR